MLKLLILKKTVSILGYMTIEAARLAKLGRSIEEIKAKIEEINQNSAYYLTVNNLTSLVKTAVSLMQNTKSQISSISNL